MVGDAVKDFQASKDNGVPCVLMSTYSDAPEDLEALAEREGAPLIDSLADLPELLTRLPSSTRESGPRS